MPRCTFHRFVVIVERCAFLFSDRLVRPPPLPPPARPPHLLTHALPHSPAEVFVPQCMLLLRYDALNRLVHPSLFPHSPAEVFVPKCMLLLRYDTLNRHMKYLEQIPFLKEKFGWRNHCNALHFLVHIIRGSARVFLSGICFGSFVVLAFGSLRSEQDFNVGHLVTMGLRHIHTSHRILYVRATSAPKCAALVRQQADPKAAQTPETRDGVAWNNFYWRVDKNKSKVARARYKRVMVTAQHMPRICEYWMVRIHSWMCRFASCCGHRNATEAFAIVLHPRGVGICGLLIRMCEYL